MAYSYEQLVKMGAKPAEQRNPSKKNGYTYEELVSQGAKPAEQQQPDEGGFLGAIAEYAGRPGAVMRTGISESIKEGKKGGVNSWPVAKGLLGAGKALFQPTASAPTGRDVLTEAGVMPLVESSAGRDALARMQRDSIAGIVEQGVDTDPDRLEALKEGAPDFAAQIVEQGTDPLNLPFDIPAGALAAAALRPAVKPVMRAAKAVATKIPEKTMGLLNKGLETMTGLPADTWASYIKDNRGVKALEKTFGTSKEGVRSAADNLRDSIRTRVNQVKSALGEKIDMALAHTPEMGAIDTQPIVYDLEQARKRLNPNIPEHVSAISEIDEMVDILLKNAPDGKLTPQTALEVQKSLQQRGWKQRSKDGAFFSNPEQSQIAAKEAAHSVREGVGEAMPDVDEANRAFSNLHGVEDTFSPGLIDNSKKMHAYVRAGLDSGSTEAKQLQQLSDWLNQNRSPNDPIVDLVKEAREFATYRRFSELPWTAVDSTGKAVLRAGAGAAGYGAASGSGADTPTALLVGLAASSPTTARRLVDAGILTANAAKSVRRGGSAAGRGLINAGKKAGEKIGEKSKGLLEGTKKFIKDEEGSFDPNELFKLLVPGQKNTYDLKKARELVGEPKKRGLLDAQIDRPADVVPHGKPWKTISPTDKEIAQKLGDKVFNKKQPLSQSEADFLAKLKNRIGSDVRDTNPELQSLKDAIYEAEEASFRLTNDTNADGVVKSAFKDEPAEPSGLVTSLDIEPQKGLIQDKPGEVKGFTSDPKAKYPTHGIPQLKDGEVVTAADGKKYKIMGEYSHRDPENGRVYWTLDRSQPGAIEKQISERELFGDKYKDVFAKEDASRAAQNESFHRSSVRAAAKSNIRKRALEGITEKPGSIGEAGRSFNAFMEEKLGFNWSDANPSQIDDLQNEWRKEWANITKGADVVSLSVEGGPSSPRDPRFKKGKGAIEKQTRVIKPSEGGGVARGVWPRGSEKRGLIKKPTKPKGKK